LLNHSIEPHHDDRDLGIMSGKHNHPIQESPWGELDLADTLPNQPVRTDIDLIAARRNIQPPKSSIHLPQPTAWWVNLMPIIMMTSVGVIVVIVTIMLLKMNR